MASMRNNANPPSMINCSMRLESNSRDILTFPLIVRMATRVAHNVLAVLRRGDAERMQVFAKELVALQPHVLFARSSDGGALEGNAYNPDRVYGGLRSRR